VSVLPRREFLRLGLGGFAGLSLANLYLLQAQSGRAPNERAALIVVWLRGGASSFFGGPTRGGTVIGRTDQLGSITMARAQAIIEDARHAANLRRSQVSL